EPDEVVDSTRPGWLRLPVLLSGAAAAVEAARPAGRAPRRKAKSPRGRILRALNQPSKRRPRRLCLPTGIADDRHAAMRAGRAALRSPRRAGAVEAEDQDGRQEAGRARS